MAEAYSTLFHSANVAGKVKTIVKKERAEDLGMTADELLQKSGGPVDAERIHCTAISCKALRGFRQAEVKP